MRKKSKRANVRKFRFRSLFARGRADDESDWFRFEEVPAPTWVSPRRKIRRRLFAARVMAFACLSVSVPLGIKWGHDHVFFQNEEFILRTLEIETDGVLSRERLAEIANVAPGMNLMELDLGLVQDQISKLPQVEKVTVSRELPDRLQIRVRERMGVAWLSTPPLGIRPWDMERGFLLDEHGHLFRCLDLNEGMKSLPVVEIFKLDEPVEGTRIHSEGGRAALRLMLESDKHFLNEGLVVREVRVREEWALECEYANGLKVTFGLYDFHRGLEDLAVILDRMEGTGRVVRTVNVAAVRNIPVTFADAAPEPTVPTPAAEPPPAPTASTPAATAPAAPAVEPSAARELDVVSAQEKHLRSILKGG